MHGKCLPKDLKAFAKFSSGKGAIFFKQLVKFMEDVNTWKV